MKARQIITHLAVLLLLVTPQARAAAPADGDNLATLAYLCPALQLADGDITLHPEQSNLDGSLQDLLALNMSLADAAWAAQFKASPPGATPVAATEQQQKQQAGTPEQIAAWTAAKANVDNTAKFKDVLAKYGYTQENASKLIPLKGPIAQYADAAFGIQQATKTSEKDDKTDSDLKALIKTAIYGHDGGYDATKKEEMGLQGTQNRENHCTAQSNSNPIQTISTMVACLCAVKDDMVSGKAPCGPHADATLKWQADGPPQTPLWPKIRSICPKADGGTVTADRIAAAIAAAKMAFFSKGNDLYVGKFDMAGCDGSNNGACIKYTDQASNSVPSFKQAAWIDKLETVETSLRTRQQNQDIQKQAQTKIETLKQLVKAAAKHAEKLTAPTTQHHSNPKLATTNDKNSQAQKTADCSKLEKAECKPDVGCRYNETTNKCEEDPKSPVVQANKEAKGGATNSEGKNYSGKKTEGECKDSCKWDGKECKDSIFLFRKKFFLIVFAFLVLLF
ncbi:variant surface glycoprotein (VSG, atypical), putative [Trypanosoma brucei brucei TREU927]|uniref:Variant surface glycoprotein (VSG, atypical), putative n=1 Tax=Trypanosoma brucei brucei (strain 927/4 GUTat10.1) TaxID=185431 RepID=Q38G42_TRYB2|nr:variant surface glycoprotein [Trypanosoma brucei brucei TREU927]EAN76228.1 variant surface glycoprotein (VSG, atypical), putative [Trypanosoma brucei brucei TREU927]